MAKEKRQANRIALRPGLNIGQLAAEDDNEFLSDAFISQPILAHVLDHANHKSIVLGRTGTGKTALLRHIRTNQPRVYAVIPMEVSLNYISKFHHHKILYGAWR